MRVGSEARQYADNVVKGEGIHPVGLGEVFFGWKVLKVLKDMKAADIPSFQGDDVVNVVPVGAAREEFVNGSGVVPRWGCLTNLYFLFKASAPEVGLSVWSGSVTASSFLLFLTISLQKEWIGVYGLQFSPPSCLLCRASCVRFSASRFNCSPLGSALRCFLVF